MHFKNALSPFSNKIKTGGTSGVAPVNIVAPSISRIGNSIICNKGDWSGTEPIDYAYVFIRSFDGGVTFEVVQSSTSNTYPLSSTDDLGLIRCNVVTSNGILPNGFAASNDLNLGVLIPTISISPNASGQPFVSRILTATNGTWNGTAPITYSYQWQRSIDGGANYTDIPGATNNTYTLQSPDSGYKVRCRVRATNAFTFTDSFTNVIDVVLTILDRYSLNHLGAYHMRLQRGAYFGNNLQEIRRTSDSSLINIGHDANGEIDIAAAIAHAGGVNRVIRSQDFSSSWSVSGTLVSTNNLAPDGSNTATLWQLGGQYHAITQGENNGLIPSTSIVAPTAEYTYSIYVKKVNNSQIRITTSSVNPLYVFDFDNPQNDIPNKGSFVSLPNGWFRISIVITGSQAVNGFRIQGHHSSASGTQYLIWGAQWNKGNVATTYVPTNANPSGFARVRTYFDHSSNARNAVASQAAREDFIVVDGEAIYEAGQLVTARYDSTHAGSGGYVVTTTAIGSNTTAYSKYRRFTNQYAPMNGIYEHQGSSLGFSDPGTYNTSLPAGNDYKIIIWNRAVPNAQAFRRIVADSSWTAGTLLNNLTLVNPNWTQIRGEFFGTWGRVVMRGDLIYNASHDLPTMQAISLLM